MFSQLIATIVSCVTVFSSSTIIQHIKGHCSANHSSAMAYFYFDFQSREKQTCQSFLRSLITQFSYQIPTIPEPLMQLYSWFESTLYQPDVVDLAITLKEVVQELPDALLVADALDECSER